MAGKQRHGIDYAGWSVDIFDSDTKIDKLLDKHGWIGFSVYFYLCMRAFASDGYFYQWGYDLCASTARKMGGGITADTVKEVADYCFKVGLFDKDIFDRHGILTSRGIQRSYWAVLKARRVKLVIKDYWLLEKSECDGVAFIKPDGTIIEKPPDAEPPPKPQTKKQGGAKSKNQFNNFKQNDYDFDDLEKNLTSN